MNNDYLCPKCSGYLNLNRKIIISVKNRHGNKGILLLDPRLGDYTVEMHPLFNYEEGETLEIFCPICHSDLGKSNTNENLAKIIMKDAEGNIFDILFSKIVGERCTYKIKGDLVESFGDAAAKYTNFFGEAPLY